MSVVTSAGSRVSAVFDCRVPSAIEAARLFKKVYLAEAELENIFSSISDMVFMTDNDYTIKNVNQAVVNKIGLPRERIVGSKCFKIFHGTDEPWPRCPHHKTSATSNQAYVRDICATDM